MSAAGAVRIISVGDLEDVARYCQEQGAGPMALLAEEAEVLGEFQQARADRLIREGEELVTRLGRKLGRRLRRGA